MSENPLKQYFRRPSIYIKLPSGGKNYTQDVLEMPVTGELPIYPMTAIDEVTSRTPDALFNGQAIVDIIKSCVPCIKDPWRINSIDLDSIIIAIRIASNGEEMDIMSICPSCNNEGKYGLNLMSILADQKDVDYSKSLKVRELEIKFRPLTYAEKNKTSMAQYEIQKILVMLDEFTDLEEKKKHTTAAIEKLNSIMGEAFSCAIHSISTPETVVTEKHFIREFLDSCDKKTSEVIKEKIAEYNEYNKLKPFHLKCMNCSHEYDQPIALNIVDFFG